MRFYGNINLGQNQIQQASLESEYSWPTSPVVGQILFMNKVVYICVQVTGNLPVWIPLTREVEMYVHVQDTAGATWNITHDLNTTFCIVQVFDGNNQMVIPQDVTINSNSSITISFGVAAAGRAVVVTGSLDGNQKPTYAVEFNQTTPQSTWVITHNLGYQPIVRIFSGSYEIQPASIFHNSNSQVTVSFTSATTGVAKLI
jgi:hypothetical protein